MKKLTPLLSSQRPRAETVSKGALYLAADYYSGF